MKILDYVTRPWLKAFDFYTTTTRTEFCLYLIPHFIVTLILFQIYVRVNNGTIGAATVVFMLMVAFQWVLIPLSARRLRDARLSTMYLFLLLIPYLGQFLLAFPLLFRGPRRVTMRLPDGTVAPAVGPNSFLKSPVGQIIYNSTRIGKGYVKVSQEKSMSLSLNNIRYNETKLFAEAEAAAAARAGGRFN